MLRATGQRQARQGRSAHAPKRPPRLRRLSLEPLEARHLLTQLPGLSASLDGAEGESLSPLVGFRLATVDESGQPIDAVTPGQEVYLEAWVRDLRTDALSPGVFAAYLDVLYDDQLLEPVELPGSKLGFDIAFGDAYQNGLDGRIDLPGLIDEVGAFQTDFGPLGAGEFLLFRMPFTTPDLELHDDLITGLSEDAPSLLLDVLANDVINGGVAQFHGEPADIAPLHNVLLYRPILDVPGDRLRFSPAELEILDRDRVTIEQLGVPSAGGSAWLAPDGRHVVYQPAEDFHGTETFTYSLGGQEAMVTIVIESVNDPPLAQDDIYRTSTDVPLSVGVGAGVLHNDHDKESDPLQAVLVSAPSSGTVELQEDGSFVYTPAPGFVGRDTFTYVAADAVSVSPAATVRIDVGTPAARLRVELADSDGQAAQRFRTDQDLRVRVWVQDVRDEYSAGRGVFSAYLDLLYDQDLWSPLLSASLPRGFEIEFGQNYTAPGSGDASVPGIVDEVGSFSESLIPLGGDEMLLFEMPVQLRGPLAADDTFLVSASSRSNVLDVLRNELEAVWTTRWEAESADEQPVHDVHVYEPTDPLQPDQVLYEGADVELVNTSLTLQSVSAPVQGGTATISEDGNARALLPCPGLCGSRLVHLSGGGRARAHGPGHGIGPGAGQLAEPAEPIRCQ